MLSNALVSERIELKENSPMNWSFYGRAKSLLNQSQISNSSFEKSREIIQKQSDGLL